MIARERVFLIQINDTIIKENRMRYSLLMVVRFPDIRREITRVTELMKMKLHRPDAIPSKIYFTRFHLEITANLDTVASQLQGDSSLNFWVES